MNNSSIHFMNLSADKCLQVYPVVEANAKRHFRIAEILVNAGEYSNAVSHLILGSEELIKALTLFIEGKGFHFSQMPHYKKIFFNHGARHSIMQEFFSVWIFCKSLLNVKERTITESKFLYGLKIAINILDAGINGIVHHEWWGGADRLKQNGFYVDYLNGIISPDSIDKAAYTQAMGIVMSFRRDVHGFIRKISSASEKELQALKESFDKSDLKVLIQEGIVRSQKKK